MFIDGRLILRARCQTRQQFFRRGSFCGCVFAILLVRESENSAKGPATWLYPRALGEVFAARGGASSAVNVPVLWGWPIVLSHFALRETVKPLLKMC